MSLWRNLSILIVVPYTPIGVIVSVLRLAIYLHALIVSHLLQSCYTIKRFVLIIMGLTLGIWIEVKRPQSLNGRAVVVVSNHVTVFDHLVLHLCHECVTPHSHVFHWGSSFLHSESSTTIVDSINASIKEKKASVHLLPEVQPTALSGLTSSFRPELLKSVDIVQPVALEVVRLPIDSWIPHPMHWLLELMWLFFLPITYFSVRFLDPISRCNSSETDEVFTDRIRQSIIMALESKSSKQTSSDEVANIVGTKPLPATANTAAPIEEHPDSSETAVRFRTPVAGPPAVSGISTFEHLVPVVREVLTDVPVSYIQDALVNFNGDVDEAIDYLVSSNYMKTPSGDTELLPPSRFNTAADVFSAYSDSRQQSLQERRNALLAYARNRLLVSEQAPSS